MFAPLAAAVLGLLPPPLTLAAKAAAPAGPVEFVPANAAAFPERMAFRTPEGAAVPCQRIPGTERWALLAPAVPVAGTTRLASDAAAPVDAATAVAAKEGIEFRVRGELVTVLRTQGASRPYCWPVLAPGGAAVTADAPADHPHHRSLWFAHGKVDGHDFWSQDPRKAGKTIARTATTVSGPAFAEARLKVEWVARDGKVIAKDDRRYRVYAQAEPFVLDFEIALSGAGPQLTMGDDKEGTFGVRVAPGIAVDAKRGGKLVNSAGAEDAAVWGQPAAWCDYFGPTEKGIAGVAILDHPGNVRHPTTWHARTYGLFCANPFGLSHFAGKPHDGTLALPPGEPLRLRYRMLLHRGDAKAAAVAERFAAFAGGVRVTG